MVWSSHIAREQNSFFPNLYFCKSCAQNMSGWSESHKSIFSNFHPLPKIDCIEEFGSSNHIFIIVERSGLYML